MVCPSQEFNLIPLTKGVQASKWKPKLKFHPLLDVLGDSVNADSIVVIQDFPVMYVAGKAGAPIGEQAPQAFKELEAKLSSLKGRRFYGVVVGDEYRACVAIDPHDDAATLPHPTWTIPGGRYVRRRIPNWEENVQVIAPTCQALCRRSDFDPSRPIIEYYRSRRELFVMVPVQ